MTFPEDSCKHWTLGCTLRSSWISPGPDHYVAREIVDLPSSAETRPGPRLPALRLVCVLSTLQWNKKGPSLQEPSRPSLLSREQTSPSLPALCLVCFLNASVEQERTEPARTKCVCPAAGLRFYLRFEFTRPLVPLATAALKKGLSAGFAEINSQNSQLSTSQWQQEEWKSNPI
ncbi:uncharacterized protein LOC129634548 isoform X10 [Bubalus kerabau]|uniref:uncharacterized protein LOC129634548 isoform X10 n=1 Tax=Bubalus carabanensis TaxID=3119969 RepID=UPI00244E8498|nr:uncharacterized protein LOC129634548 isoform X10 [Bubalus carabanensis]